MLVRPESPLRLTLHAPLPSQSDKIGQRKGIDNDVLPLFPNPEGHALTKNQVNSLIRMVVQKYDNTITEEALCRYSAHTFRITGARWYAKMGVDCTTIALHGRWSSSAVLSYLAEAPLCSLRAKMRPPNLLSNANAEQIQRNQACHEVKSRLRASADAASPDPLPQDDNLGNHGYVWNVMSSMVHIRKHTDEQTHSWITRCGWKWAGKSHVFSSNEEPNDLEVNWKKRPKCYNIKKESRQMNDETTSSSSSSESSSG